MSSTLTLCFKLNPSQSFPNRIQSEQYLKYFPSQAQHTVNKNAHVCFAFSPSNSSSNNSNPLNYGPQEEARWLREEQRWLREEQRWLREESRWRGEREALLNDIQRLNIRIRELESLNSAQQTSVSEAIANMAKLLQVLKEAKQEKNVNIIPESIPGALPFLVEAVQKEEEVVVKEEIKLREREGKGKTRPTLKMGSQGDDVHAMQEALQKLGFYSGEEDMEFFSFSAGTERAVKTWQSTLGAPEDGIMTGELLETLFAEQKLVSKGRKNPEMKDTNIADKGSNGAAIASVTEISKVEETIGNKGSEAEVNMSQHRVFLLGENRWEEPSRLAGRNVPPETKSGRGKTIRTCVSCRGEGRLLCMECDGSGEPNIEPQFLEWIDEGTKCPYCEGAGYIVCDVCEGKKVIEA